MDFFGLPFRVNEDEFLKLDISHYDSILMAVFDSLDTLTKYVPSLGLIKTLFLLHVRVEIAIELVENYIDELVSSSKIGTVENYFSKAEDLFRTLHDKVSFHPFHVITSLSMY